MLNVRRSFSVMQDCCNSAGPPDGALVLPTHLVYPDQPVLRGVGLLQHIQFKVFVPDFGVPDSVIARRTLCKEDPG